MRRPERCPSCGGYREPGESACSNCQRPWGNTLTDDEFWRLLIDDAHWLFYGDLEEHFTTFVVTVFQHELATYGFSRAPMTPDFAVAYWLFLSELVALDLAEYGTSPRGAWLTPDGERFKRIVLERHAAGTLEWLVDWHGEEPKSS